MLHQRLCVILYDLWTALDVQCLKSATKKSGDDHQTTDQQRTSLVHLQQGDYYKWNPDISLILQTPVSQPASRISPSVDPAAPLNLVAGLLTDADHVCTEDAEKTTSEADGSFELPPSSGEQSFQQDCGFIESDVTAASDVIESDVTASDVIDDAVQSANVSPEQQQRRRLRRRDSLFDFFSPATSDAQRQASRRQVRVYTFSCTYNKMQHHFALRVDL